MKARKSSIIKRNIRHLSPRHIIKARLSARTVQKVADKYGLVYFGYVNHKTDDHKLLRGFTLSQTQIDDHYSVGTVQGYTTAFCARNDVVETKHKTEKRCHWFIVAVDLHVTATLPHFYVGPIAGNELFESTFAQLHKIDLGNTAEYPHKFISNYDVYSRPSDVIDLEKLFPPAVAGVIVSHFDTMSFELEDNVVYIYSESKYPTEALVDKMLQNGIWLAKIFDAVSGARQTLESADDSQDASA